MKTHHFLRFTVHSNKMKTILTTVIAIFTVWISFGQEDTIARFDAPSFPAGSILGIEANEISRPKSISQVRLSLQNNFLDSNNQVIIPDNFVIELNPFMLSPRKNFNYKDYLSNKMWDAFRQNSTVSLAATNSFIVSDSIKTDALSFGARLVLYNGKVSEDVEKLYNDQLEKTDLYSTQKVLIGIRIRQFLDETDENDELNKDALLDFLNKSLTGQTELLKIVAAVIPNLNSLTRSNVMSKFDAEIDEYGSHDNEISVLKDLIKQVRNDRHGFHVELNGAMALSFPTNDFSFSMVPRGGVWLNVSYLPLEMRNSKYGPPKKASRLEFLGLVRYLWSNDNFADRYYEPVDTVFFDIGNFFDVGIRMNYEYQKFSAGLEYIYRQRQDRKIPTSADGTPLPIITSPENNFKLNLNLNYRLTDKILVTYNLGKNYRPSGQGGNLISTFSVNFALGQLSTKDLLR